MRRFILILAILSVMAAGCAKQAVVSRTPAPRPSPRPSIMAAEVADSFAMRQQAFSDAVDSILDDTVMTQAQCGLYIVALDRGRQVLDRGRSHLFVPASANKVFITVLGFRHLGPYHTFPTKVLAESLDRRRGAVDTLYLKGYGDPDLSTADLEDLAFRVKSAGVLAVNRAIVADASYFDTTRFGAGWMWDEGPYAYNAPISALSVNKNVFEVGIAASPDPGTPVRVEIAPRTGYLKVDNQGITAIPEVRRRLKVDRAFRDGRETVTVTGVLPTSDPPQYVRRSVINPALFAGNLFADALKRAGVRCPKTVMAGPAPDSFQEIAVHQSLPLFAIVQFMNKESDNFTAEMLFRYLRCAIADTAADSTGNPFKRYFMENGFKTADFSIVDGSGLSRYNLCSPEQLVWALESAYADPVLRPEFLSSLPVAGIDGTLAFRLGDSDFRARVRAKTGTMRGISSLAGFAFGPGDRVYCFAFMFNNYTARPHAIRAVQDAILKRLLMIAP